ncbi:MAG: hypothetical protein M1834_000043 [Cirrosporium novae-zelandiae]|nr:MAG: hypothetical protein M1834_000043 [Cirrosporium novae-zelandiae]
MILNEAFGEYKDALQEDWGTGFKLLLKQDQYSTRQYLRERMGYDFFSIQWMETVNTSSGLFDQAFSESVIDSLPSTYGSRDLELHPSQKDAIRCLHYDDSAKVAIKFKYPWWIKDCGIRSGGVASTDLPLRTCVYPSYNLKDSDGDTAVLLCSYTWSQDATRIGSLIKPDSPSGEEELLQLMFDDLAKPHENNFEGLSLPEIRSRIANTYITHHAWSYSHDPRTAGAFALFGPDQFKNLYPYLSRPAADSKFHIVGEASSAHHAWVVGSV